MYTYRCWLWIHAQPCGSPVSKHCSTLLMASLYPPALCLFSGTYFKWQLDLDPNIRIIFGNLFSSLHSSMGGFRKYEPQNSLQIELVCHWATPVVSMPSMTVLTLPSLPLLRPSKPPLSSIQRKLSLHQSCLDLLMTFYYSYNEVQSPMVSWKELRSLRFIKGKQRFQRRRFL